MTFVANLTDSRCPLSVDFLADFLPYPTRTLLILMSILVARIRLIHLNTNREAPKLNLMYKSLNSPRIKGNHLSLANDIKLAARSAECGCLELWTCYKQSSGTLQCGHVHSGHDPLGAMINSGHGPL